MEMRKVSRGPEPAILQQNKAQWTQELKDQIQQQGSYKAVSSTYKNRYRTGEVHESLKEMYQELCCYCESKIGASTYGRIEHLCPKSLPQFYHLHFEWDNLHWCCEKCNINKGYKWDDANPIIDPTVDNPEDHLMFSYDIIDATSARGKTTIEHVLLNRRELVTARAKVLAKVMRIIERISNEKDSFKKSSFRADLCFMAQENEEYSSFILHLVKRYLKSD
jgi:uncharacterized protein (TIGR02646 family)